MKDHGKSVGHHGSRNMRDRTHENSGSSGKPSDHQASPESFKRTASHVHRKNLLSGGSIVNRGGIRL